MKTPIHQLQRTIVTLFSLALFGMSALALEMKRTIEELPLSLQEKAPGINPGYIVGRPAASSGDEKPALLIYLHGGGGIGADIKARVGKNAPIKYWNKQETHPFIIVAPQCLPENKWEADSLQVLLGHLKQTLDFDPARIYLTGFSMGGYGTWKWAATYPENFAAIAPMSGGLGQGGPIDISPNLDQWLDNLQVIPTWIFHGSNDTTVPADRSEEMFQSLKERGLKDLGITIVPGGGHNIQDSYTNLSLYEWMLKHK